MKKSDMPFREWLRVIFWINHLPILLMLFGATMSLTAVINLTPLVHIFYWAAIVLFILLPFCTYTRLKTFRILLTMFPGVIMIFVYLFEYDIIWRSVMCITGVGGFWYFLQDYKRQYGKYAYAKNQNIEWFFDERLLKRYLNSKCSRQVFLRTADRVDYKKAKLLRRKVRNVYGQKWYHFFPSSPKPLIGIWRPREYDWLTKKLNTLGIET